MASDIGIKIDNRYEVQGELGRGGMGIVYKATDRKMDRMVAIKVMTAQVAGRDEYYERFLREAKSVARMQHPNIVVVHDYGYHAGAPYMAMEYVEGIPLDKLINSRANLSLLVKVDYIIQVCRALHYAHQLGIVHRDVKPGNIMVLQGGQRVKLLDFGIARAGAASLLSKSGLLMGTTCYMSPEQTRGQRNLDGRADIFSAGVVLYELVAGAIPWSGEGDYEIMTKIINDPLPPLSNRLKNYPHELDPILERALAKEAESRYQTAEEMAVELCELEAPLKEQVLEDALSQFEQGDLYRANELVSQILRIDTRHRKAMELRAQLQQLSELEQKTEKVRQLRAAAEEAVGQRRYQEALAAVEQAIAIHSTDPELLQYRGLIRHELKRKEDVRKKLELARRAQEINDLSSAAELVDRALEVDPTDTHARMMKSALQQEKTRQQLQELAEEASRAIAGHAFPQAKELIRQLEALGPAFASLPALTKALLETEAEEKRRVETEDLLSEIRQVLKSDVQRSLLLTEEALAKFPSEPRFARLRAQAEALRDATERERTIQEQIAAVNRFVEGGEIDHALGTAESALKQFADDHRLQSAAAKLREVVGRERQAQALQGILLRARDAMGTEEYEEVVKLLAPAQATFPSSEEVAKLLQSAQEAIAQNIGHKIAENARKRESAEVLERKLASETNPDAQVGSAEEALRTLPLPGNELVERALWRVRDLQEQIASAIQRAETFERTRNYGEAIREWEQVRELFPQHPQAQAQLARLSAILKPAPKFAVTTPSRAPSPDPPATSIAGSAAAVRKATAVAKIAPPPITKPRPVRQAVAELREPVPIWKKPIVMGGAAAAVLVTAFLGYVLWPVSGVPIRFETDPPGAQVSVNRQRCIAPCVFKLKSGQHMAEATQQGYSSTQREISVGSQPETISLSLPLASNIGVLFLESNVEQAEVVVDGELKGTTAEGKTAITLSPGTHQVLVRKHGYIEQTQTVEINSGGGERLYFELNGQSQPNQLALDVHLLIRSHPGATIRLGDNRIGQVRSDGTYSGKVSAGTHRLQLSLPGYQSWSTTITVKSGDKLPVVVDLKQSSKAAPLITTFTASTTDIQPGQSAELRWQIQNATEVTVDQGIGPVPSRGARQVAPSATTTYRLTAKGEGPAIQSSVTVNVSTIARPSIMTFEAGSEKILQGQSTKLIWGTQNATEVTILPELGAIPARGSREVRPPKTTTYTLTAKGTGGTVTQSVQLVVDLPPPLPTPPSVRTGEDSDAKSIKDAIERYKEAYESMSIDEVKKIWPDISKKQQNAMKEGFKAAKAIKLSLKCAEPSISGDSSQCDCSQAVTYTGDSGKRQAPQTYEMVFMLKKKNGTWHIADVRGR